MKVKQRVIYLAPVGHDSYISQLAWHSFIHSRMHDVVRDMSSQYQWGNSDEYRTYTIGYH